ncbi:MAG: hypothetical protein OXU54_03230 [Gammaproteobacteria bacterium]|nr:hypothetical protein [Gammaproteobacteria bacterium]
MAKRKTLHQLCQSHANGFLLHEDYRQARRALISDILERNHPLQERDYPFCDGRQKKPGDTAIRTRRHMAKNQAKQLAQLRKENAPAKPGRGKIALALAVIFGLLLLLGAILLPLSDSSGEPANPVAPERARHGA